MFNSHSQFIEIEAATPDRLQKKITMREAAGWVVDGGSVKLVDYHRDGRAVRGCAQAMCRPEPIARSWELRS